MAALGDPNGHPCAPPVIGAIELPTHAVVVATNSEQAESKRAIELHLMVTLFDHVEVGGDFGGRRCWRQTLVCSEEQLRR